MGVVCGGLEGFEVSEGVGGGVQGSRGWGVEGYSGFL